MVPRDRAQSLVDIFEGALNVFAREGGDESTTRVLSSVSPLILHAKMIWLTIFRRLGDESMNRLLIISWPSTRGWLKSRSVLEAISITNEGKGIIIVNRNLYLNFARMSNKEGTMLSFLSSYLRERIVDRRIVVVFTRFTFQSVGKILKF